MTKPKILFVANAVLGWRTYARQLETVLAARQDVDGTVLYRTPGRWAMQLARRHADGPLGRRLRPFDPIQLFAGRSGHDIRQAVARLRPDVVHLAAHWPAGALLAARVPFTIALDATRAGLSRDLPLPGWGQVECQREARLCRAAAHVFPMSQWAADSLQDDYDIPKSRITVQPPTLLPEHWPENWPENWPERWPDQCSREPARDRPQILFVGNDLQRKGAHRLARWVEGPLDGRCHLHIVSTDRKSRPPNGPHVTFHGPIPHDRLISEVMPSMDIFCLPTRLDMSPFVLVEAAAAGLPSVASRLAGISDLVSDGATGLLVQPDDDSGFVQALRRLIEDAPLRRRMGTAARRRAEEAFDGRRGFNHLIDRLVTIAAAQGSDPL
ncbi:glycosyltransferase family 4 protein [Antarctobacter sp.]|uniref:glycosyltransferase family 4 protein n=1 Tax=Antarctobacter sp. TaxID=1872577 RepID=UPI003A8EBF59